MVEYSHGGQVPPIGNGRLKSFGNTEILERAYISPCIKDDILIYITAVVIDDEYLRKIIAEIAVRNLRGQHLLVAMHQFKIPGVLGFYKGIARFIGVFIQRYHERIERLKGRPVYPSSQAEGERIIAVCLE
jgi:hypothetical protein